MWQQPQFDEHQFVHRGRVVSAETGISFQDYEGMHVKRRKLKAFRRLATPDWVMNDAKVRTVALNYLEDRFYLRDRSGTDQERIKRIETEVQRHIPRKVKELEDLQARYAAEPLNREYLAVQIQNLDTDIVLSRRGLLAVVVSVVYMYYRQGLSSVEIAEQLRIKPPMVRVWLYRFNKVERYLREGRPPRKVRGPNRRKGNLKYGRVWTFRRIARLKTLRESGKTFKRIAEMMGLKRPQEAQKLYAKYVERK